MAEANQRNQELTNSMKAMTSSVCYFTLLSFVDAAEGDRPPERHRESQAAAGILAAANGNHSVHCGQRVSDESRTQVQSEETTPGRDYTTPGGDSRA